MNIVLIAALLVSTFGLIFAEESNYCDNAENFIYERVSSNISFSVLLKLHEGDDCAMENSRYVQKASEIVTIINLINISPLLDGIKIGAEIFDTCLLNECLKTDHQMIPDFVIQPNGTYFLGTLVPEELLGDKVPNSLPPSPRFTISRDHNIRLLVTSTVRTLRQLKIRKIDVLLSSSSAFLDDFRVKGTWAVICIKKKSHTTDYTSLCECNAKRRTILIALAAENLPEFANATSSCGCNDRFVLVITGSDVDMDTLQEYVYWMNDSYVIGPADLLIKFPEIKSEEEALSLKSNLSTLNYSLNFISTSTAVSRIYQSLKIKLRNECGRNDALSVCPELTEFDPLEALVSASPFFYDIEELAKEMQLDLENMVLYVSFKINDNEDINPVEIMTKDMIYNQHPLELIQSMPTIIQKEAVCHDHVTCNECPNFVFQPKSEEIFFWKDLPIRFKTEVWVSCLATLSLVGMLCCLFSGIYIISRIVKNTILEGNPILTIFLSLSTTAMYLSIIPFLLNSGNNAKYTNILCLCKLIASSVCFNVVFSLLLSRSVMILTCDYDGNFLSHINGYLQFFLFFFILIGQLISLGQFGTIYWLLPDSSFSCYFMQNNYSYLIHISYNVLLLIILAFIVPFIIRSKRNYHEAFYFALATLFMIILWTLWLFIWIYYPYWKDFAQCLGLTGTACIVTIFILIPRTYLITGGLIRDQFISGSGCMSSFNRNNNYNVSTPNIADVRFKSTQALYDSVAIEPTTTSTASENMAFVNNELGVSNLSIISNNDTASVDINITPNSTPSDRDNQSFDDDEDITYENCYPVSNPKITKL